MVDKSNMQYFNCQKLGHFARKCNSNKKESQEDEDRVVRQEFDGENTLLITITKGNAAAVCCRTTTTIV